MKSATEETYQSPPVILYDLEEEHTKDIKKETAHGCEVEEELWTQVDDDEEQGSENIDFHRSINDDQEQLKEFMDGAATGEPSRKDPETLEGS